MIKKILGLGIVLLGFIGFSFGEFIISSYTAPNNTQSTFYIFSGNDTFTLGTETQVVNNDLSFNFNDINLFGINNQNYGSRIFYNRSFFYEDGVPTVFLQYNYSSNYIVYYKYSIVNVCYVESSDFNTIGQTCSSYSYGDTNSFYQSNYSKNFQELVIEKSGKKVVNYSFFPISVSAGQIALTRGFFCSTLEDNSTFCFAFIDGPISSSDNTPGPIQYFGTGYLRSMNNPSINYLYDNYDYISSIADTESPFVGGGDNSQGTIVPVNGDVDSIINYYETRYSRNEDMCYVGTDNLSGVYGTSGVGFENGTGESIFGLYYSIYSSYGNNIVKNVGKFINVWLLNYSQWFYNNDNIRWLATDNGPDTNVSYIYTGFTFPFENKPVAIYFMASNLYDGYSTETSQGEDMAFYCYSKLNYQQIKDGDINFEEVKSQVNSGIVGRIEDYNNYQFGNNTGNYQVPTSGSFRDSFGTGYENADMDLDKTFSDYFTEITNVFQNYSPLYSTGIIPDYILYALIFLLLFRIMKH